MTDLDLNAALALADAATPGPWELDANGAVRVPGSTRQNVIANCYDPDDDAAFIAGARELVPALAVEVTRLRERPSYIMQRADLMTGLDQIRDSPRPRDQGDECKLEKKCGLKSPTRPVDNQETRLCFRKRCHTERD